MAQTYPAGNPWKILTTDNGNIGVYGAPTSVSSTGGLWTFDFIPDVTWTGQLTVMGRTRGLSTTDPTGFLVIPFRKVYLNAAAGDWSMVASGTAITGRSLIVVPAYGIDVGIAVTCTAGFGTLYAQPMSGPAVP